MRFIRKLNLALLLGHPILCSCCVSSPGTSVCSWDDTIAIAITEISLKMYYLDLTGCG